MTVAQLEAHVGTSAVLIYGLIQSGKLVVPAYCARWNGWRAVLLNLLLSAVSVLATTSPDQRFSFASLAAILLTASAAAGIHGTVSKLGAPTDCSTLPKGDT